MGTAENDPIRAAYDAWLVTSHRSDDAFRRVVEGKVRTTAGATRLARETEEREADFEALCYQAGLDPREREQAFRQHDADMRASILRKLGLSS